MDSPFESSHELGNRHDSRVVLPENLRRRDTRFRFGLLTLFTAPDHEPDAGLSDFIIGQAMIGSKKTRSYAL